ncbi:MAG: type II toxin-antitoxin system RelE/ParE family toxin [Thermoanaerobaculia bacterium]
MTPSRTHQVRWTETATGLLKAVGDKRHRKKIYETAGRLSANSLLQGKPLAEDLIGFRGLRAVGQRYRIIYSVDPDIVHVWAVGGLRREGSRSDIYELARRLLRQGLIGPSRGRGKKK